MATVTHPESAATRPRPTYAEITRDVAATLGNPSRAYYILFGFVLFVLACGVGALLYQIKLGLGVAGYQPPVMWAVYITDFVFWVGIAHCGTLISAILFLFRSEWRTAGFLAAAARTGFWGVTARLFSPIYPCRPSYA